VNSSGRRNEFSLFSKFTISVALLIPVVWVALLAALFLSGGLPEIIKSLPAVMNDPMTIRWVQDTPKRILLIARAYFVGLGICFSTRCNFHHRKKHGSAMIKTVGLRQDK
jgi:type IV secretion system protein VirD4